jgi:predicted transcriptional regulator
MAVSIRLPSEVQKRVAKLAARRDTNPHAFMLEAIAEKLEHEEAEEEFLAEAERRLEEMRSTGLGIPSDEVFAYLEARARGEKVKRPKARRTR